MIAITGMDDRLRLELPIAITGMRNVRWRDGWIARGVPNS